MAMKPLHSSAPPERQIVVSLEGVADGSELQFITTFRIGRTSACEVCISNNFVSRVHAEVLPEADGWRVRDLNSSNGIYVDGKRVDSVFMTTDTVIRLGAEGPRVSFRLPPATVPDSEKAAAAPPGEETIVAQYADRYFHKPEDDESMGEHTRYVRRAFKQVQTLQQKVHTRQRRTYLLVITVLFIAAIGVSIYTYRLHRETLRQRAFAQHQMALAHDLFYEMKALDVEIAQAERLFLATDPQRGAAMVKSYEEQRKKMQADYDHYLSTLHIYDAKSTEQHRLILRIARIFGECELDMPPEFEQEVSRYIKYWQSSGRYARDIRLAKEKGYTTKIPQALLERGLPVQFFYLAMQESDFDPYASGPMTRKGYAKGMWQFIPETGVKYGLHLGPLVDLGRPDPSDERDQVDKATDAASRYLDMLYSTDAQASGLLVMACYNWGEGAVLPLVRSMPLNPRERNFWRLLADHRSKVPQQTYDYVFYITSAAVIGENPRLFGFDFDNPLDQKADQKADQTVDQTTDQKTQSGL